MAPRHGPRAVRPLGAGGSGPRGERLEAGYPASRAWRAEESVIRRLPKSFLIGVLVLSPVLALLAQPRIGGAQTRSMRFRPVPAESTSTYERSDREAARQREAGRDSSARSTGTIPPVPPTPGGSAPETPEAP